MKFRVLRGLHNEGGKTYGPLDDGKLAEGTVGDVVDSAVDLAKVHGRIRFQPLHDSEPVDEFDAMTIPDLTGYAEENQIDLGEARKKGEIVAAVRQAVAG